MNWNSWKNQKRIENITFDLHSLVLLHVSIFALSFATEVSQYLIYFTVGISSYISSERITLVDNIVYWFHKIQRTVLMILQDWL